MVEFGPNRGDITPMTEFVGKDWQLVPFEDIAKRPLAPFQVITDIPNLSACNEVEKQVCRTVIASHIPSTSFTLRNESRVVGDRIVNHLRPKGFNGAFENAKAIVLPFNAERVVEFSPRLEGLIEDGRLHNDMPGLRVIYSGDLHSSLAGSVGSLFQEASYYIPKDSNARYELYGYLRRSLVPSTQVSEASRILDEKIVNSKEIAQSVAKFALKHVYSGGAPGLGKRS